MITLEQGKQLIDIARKSVTASFSGKKPKLNGTLKNEFSEPTGVFVTLKLNNNLRGCIGFTEATYPLYEAIVNAASAAASSDPRFPALTKEEFENVSVEVSVLTKPVAIHVRNPEDYLKQITIGKDGLFVKGTFHSGLLLPQVASEYKWDAKTFLGQTCAKAGLPVDTWQDFNECRVYKFQSLVFSEESPNGNVVQIM